MLHTPNENPLNFGIYVIEDGKKGKVFATYAPGRGSSFPVDINDAKFLKNIGEGLYHA
jgi:hypothetical protein